MKIVIAPDSFKGTFSAKGIASEMFQALPNDVQSQARIQPLADGGEGTVEVLADALHANYRTEKVMRPLGQPVDAIYAISGNTALIEMASAAGLPLVQEGQLDPAHATTTGVGELILHALKSGVKKIIIGLGGSATVDGGAGALQALGAKLLDDKDQEITKGNYGLGEIAKIDLSQVLSSIGDAELILATDVTNSLLGEKGTVRIFGPQKGVNANEFDLFESRLEHYANLLETATGKSLRNISGSGAAGGLAFGLLAAGGKIVQGFDLVCRAVGFESQIQDADLVITGEGKLDKTSLSGKVVGNVVELCQKCNVPCWIVSGFSEFGEEDQGLLGVQKIISLFPHPERDLEVLKMQTVPRLRKAFALAFSANETY